MLTVPTTPSACHAVVRFGNHPQETCNTTGTMTLLENNYLNITAIAEPVPSAEVSKVLDFRVVMSSCFAMIVQKAFVHPVATSQLQK